MNKSFPKPKKIKRSTLKNKADRLMSLRTREAGYCEAHVFDKVKCGGFLQDCHIIGRANMRLRYDPFNHVCMCSGHHVWFTNNPEAWREFIEKEWPDTWKYLQTVRNEKVKTDFEKVIEGLSNKT